MEEELLTIRQSANYIDVTVVTFFRLCEEYQLQPVNMETGVPMYRKSDLEQPKIDAHMPVEE